MLTIRSLIWETWNVAHIARHRVDPGEVEEVCHRVPVFSQAYKGRIRVIGPTHTGRMLTIILDPKGRSGVYYPVTARLASRKEQRYYQKIATKRKP